MPNLASLSRYPNMPEFARPEPEAAAGVTVSMAVVPSTPAHGATVTATYTVSGVSPVAGTPVSVTGSVEIGGKPYPVTGSFTLPGATAPVMTYSTPTAAGLTFKVSPANPAVFTAVVP
jgi:hypothetical protein